MPDPLQPSLFECSDNSAHEKPRSRLAAHGRGQSVNQPILKVIVKVPVRTFPWIWNVSVSDAPFRRPDLPSAVPRKVPVTTPFAVVWPEPLKLIWKLPEGVLSNPRPAE